LLCISENLGTVSAFHAELLGAMRAIEIAYQRNWLNFRLESDSMLVVNAFSNSTIVPWQLSNRWSNCMKLINDMNFVISHIFREGNQCADSLANFDLIIQGLFSWESAPSFISSFLVQKCIMLVIELKESQPVAIVNFWVIILYPGLAKDKQLLLCLQQKQNTFQLQVVVHNYFG
jgi:hypothetical protein